MNRAPISTPDNQAGEIQQKLMAAFKFNMEDLNCNRAGELSERQKARFFRDAAMSFFGPLLGGLVATVVLGDDSLTRIQLPFVCPVFILIAFAAIGFLSYSLNMRPVRENILASATGTLSLLPQFVGGNARAFSIGSESFAVRLDVFNVLEWDVHYRIYYTPAYKNILAIERLDGL